jgi:2-succinyl-6-hydroxy-2,4-cyclohexadiene-1-carboxylate synthase
MRIFYVHGMGGSPEDWRWVQRDLSGEALSLGSSIRSPIECAKELAAQIAPAAEEGIVLVGYSMGGRLAILMARELADSGTPLSALVLLGAGMGFASEVERENRRKADAAWADLAGQDQDEFWLRWYQQEIFASFSSLAPSVKQSWKDSRIPMNIGVLSQHLRHLGPGNHEHLSPVLERLAEKGLRVLYIVGELDKKYLELSRNMQKMGASVMVVPGAGHILPLEAPEAVATEIRGFLKRGVENG